MNKSAYMVAVMTTTYRNLFKGVPATTISILIIRNYMVCWGHSFISTT